MGSFLKNNNFEYFFHHFLYLYNYFKNNKIGNRIQAIQLYLIFSLSISQYNDENIDNYEYIGISILWIYRIYQRYIDGYFEKKY